MHYYNFFKWQVSLGKSSRFLPKLAFSKRDSVFTLYYYPSKDSLICRYRFFYDGGDILPVIGKWVEGGNEKGLVPASLPAFISKYFSFNITNLRKAIHRRGTKGVNHFVPLLPRIALISKDFFGQKQIRTRNTNGVGKGSSTDWSSLLEDLVKEKVDLYQLLLWSARNYDFSRFDEFECKVNEHLKANGRQPCPYKTLFSFFKNFILDLQSHLC